LSRGAGAETRRDQPPRPLRRGAGIRPAIRPQFAAARRPTFVAHPSRSLHSLQFWSGAPAVRLSVPRDVVAPRPGMHKRRRSTARKIRFYEIPEWKAARFGGMMA